MSVVFRSQRPMRVINRTKRGFTLIEILIVVVILGILAAIVIPQFTNASTDAANASLRSQLQTIRSQLELFRVQNGDTYPDLINNGWDDLVDNDYLQSAPRNPLQAAATATAIGAAAGADVGWIWDGADLTATDGAGAVFVE
ncbi:MAG: prepilin-type N-terminal cleavage/methylation domain-containing protein [Phycisphaerales bacterium]|nr:prepilin-type N-terminal cleavage/methylation domain-containing protein [Phycisphaerales bacterium]